MQQIEKGLWTIVDATIFVTITGMVVLITLQVGSRLLDVSIAWTEELSRFLFIWTVWLGMAAGFRHGQHPSLNILPAIVPRRAQAALRLLQPLCIAIFFAIVCWYGIELIRQQIHSGEVSAILQLGMWLTTVPLVLGSGLSVLGAVIHTIRVNQEAQHASGVEGGAI